jgi:RNA polymerase sigma-70 factor, ECF subfamily
MGICPQDAEEKKVSDECLIDAAKSGDDDAFSELVTRYKHHVFRLAARFAHDPYELDDICQDVFIKVYENLGTFRRDAPFEHWLSRITVNTCHDALRKAKHRKGHLPLEGSLCFIGDPGPEAESLARQAYETLMRGIMRLHPHERIIITLLELEERSIQDVAAWTGWSEGNVRVRAHRARQALKRILEAQYES